jgi:hypothetical protein
MKRNAKEPKGLVEVPLDLSPYLCHLAAPNWFLAAHGHNCTSRHPLLCPACGTPETRVRSADSRRDAYIIARAEVGGFCVPCGAGEITPDEPVGTQFTYVAVPMECSAGHHWLLTIGQHEPAGAGISVDLDEAVYAELYPEAKERWD